MIPLKLLETDLLVVYIIGFPGAEGRKGEPGRTGPSGRDGVPGNRGSPGRAGPTGMPDLLTDSLVLT